MPETEGTGMWVEEKLTETSGLDLTPLGLKVNRTKSHLLPQDYVEFSQLQALLCEGKASQGHQMVSPSPPLLVPISSTQ